MIKKYEFKIIFRNVVLSPSTGHAPPLLDRTLDKYVVFVKSTYRTGMGPSNYNTVEGHKLICTCT